MLSLSLCLSLFLGIVPLARTLFKHQRSLIFGSFLRFLWFTWRGSPMTGESSYVPVWPSYHHLIIMMCRYWRDKLDVLVEFPVKWVHGYPIHVLTVQLHTPYYTLYMYTQYILSYLPTIDTGTLYMYYAHLDLCYIKSRASETAAVYTLHWGVYCGKPQAVVILINHTHHSTIYYTCLSALSLVDWICQSMFAVLMSLSPSMICMPSPITLVEWEEATVSSIAS